MRTTALILTVCFCAVCASQASTVTWSSMGIVPNSLAADDQILNLGQTELATYISNGTGGGTGPYTLNGVTFISGTGPVDGVHATWTNVSGAGGDFAGLSNWSANMTAIMASRNYSGVGVRFNLILENLTVGKEYQVQFLWHDDIFAAARQMQIVGLFAVGGGSGVSTGIFDFSSVGTPDGYYIATFTADASGRQQFDFIANAGCRSEIAAVNVQSVVPEPSTMTLVFMGVSGLLLRRRKS